jgi:2-C-methyl-D-erythritol 4-phosphate cytidylyltransferase
MERYAIVVAGGHGARMSSEIPKQFLPLCGEPVLAHTLRKFGSIGTEPILVLHPDWINYWKDTSVTLDRLPVHRIVPGSTTRAGSVYNGLNALPANGLVAVHDAARPLISNSLIFNLFKQAELLGNAVPVVECRDSLRQIDHNNSRAVDRSQFRIVQTPQVFDLSLLKNAFEKGGFELYSDEASLVESIGVPIHLFPGEESNIKITFPVDFKIAEAWLNSKGDSTGF